MGRRQSFTRRLARDLRKAAQLDTVAWLDLARAALDLARANRQLGSQSAQELLHSLRPERHDDAHQHLSDDQHRLIARIAFAIPRMAARVPWRADCLVQALAAQRWLAREGIASALCLGVRKNMPSPFEAHAWLTVGDEVVTGGDISGYAPLVAPETRPA